jgi:bifunctional DNA-binding transcriptional regulator/antitoxin component of YhaV-PrlF toxin-antitoxin module
MIEVELEYNEDLDEYFIVVPDSMLRRLDWEEGDLLDYDLDDEVLRIFKI